MESATRIRDLLRALAGADRPARHFRLMEVVAVEGDTCRARLGELEIPGIRLAALTGGADDGVLLTPAVGSTVVVADLSRGALDELCVVGYSAVEAIRYHHGNTTLEADAERVALTVGGSKLLLEDGAVTFNDGRNGGLVCIDKLSQSLESLRSYCERLKTAVVAGLTAVKAGAAADGPGGATAFSNAMTGAEIRIENMENDKVMH